MPKILVTESFPFAVGGNHVVHIETGEQDVSERCAEVAVEHLKVATMLDGSGGPSVPPKVEKPADVPRAAAKAPVQPRKPAQRVTRPKGAKAAAKPTPEQGAQ